ncbi:hypothetical protein Tco_1364496, partial [Tanacetum coccineum]
PEEEPEEDDEDPEEDPADYPADRDDEDDDEEKEPTGDDVDDEDEDEDEEEKEEHLAPVDSVPPVHRMTARISIWDEPSISLPPREEVERLLALTTPPPSPLTPLSSPLPQIPSPPLPASPPASVLPASPSTSPIHLLGYRAAMIWLRAEAASTSHSLPLPPPFILSHTRPAAPSSGIPPLHLLSIDRREDRPYVTLLPQKRLGIALGPAYKVGESSSAAAARPARGLRADYGFVATMDREIRRDPERDVGYGITDSWDKIVETLQGAPISIDTELGRHMTAFETGVRQDTDEIYTRLDDEQSQRQLLASRLNMLFRDR